MKMENTLSSEEKLEYSIQLGPVLFTLLLINDISDLRTQTFDLIMYFQFT